MANIAAISAQLESFLKNNPKVENEVIAKLIQLFWRVEDGFNYDDSGYCKIFKRPQGAVIVLFKTVCLDKAEVAQAFSNDWTKPDGTYTYHDPYYEILLLLIQYGLKHNMPIAEKALFLMLISIWNHQRYHYIRYCDKWTMEYVIQVDLNDKYLARRYSSPLILIWDYFVPNLFKTYKNRVISGSAGMETLFEQAMDRIGQLFAQGTWLEDSDTGQKIAQRGLLSFYRKAKRDGNRIEGKSMSRTKPLSVPSVESSEKKRCDLYSDVLKELSYRNTPASDPEDLISKLNNATGVNANSIREIIKEMHESDHKPILFDIYRLFIEEYEHEFIIKNDYLYFIGEVFKKEKSAIDDFDDETVSHHCSFARTMKKLFTLLMDNIFKKINKRKYSDYRESQRRKIVKVLIAAAICTYQQNVNPAIVNRYLEMWRLQR